MNYVALIQGQQREICIEAVDAHTYHVVLGGKTWVVEAKAVGRAAAGYDASLQLQIEHRAVRVDVDVPGADAACPDALVLWVDGNPVPVQVLTQRALMARQQAEALKAGSGPAEVAAPMAGKVVSVLVHEGDVVTAGQGLLVVEAMKMENELRAPQDGTVRDLCAAVGGAVKSGAVVCTVA